MVVCLQCPIHCELPFAHRLMEIGTSMSDPDGQVVKDEWIEKKINKSPVYDIMFSFNFKMASKSSNIAFKN